MSETKTVRVSYTEYKYRFPGAVKVPGSYSGLYNTIEIEMDGEYVPMDKDPAFRVVRLPYCCYKERYKGHPLAKPWDAEKGFVYVYVRATNKRVECDDNYRLYLMEQRDFASGQWDAQKVPGENYNVDGWRWVQVYLKRDSDYELPLRIPTKMLYKDYKDRYSQYPTKDNSYDRRSGTIIVYLPQDVKYERAEKDKHYEARRAFREGFVDEITITPDKIDEDTINTEIPAELQN